MLIASSRHTREDLVAWSRFENILQVWSQLSSYRKHVQRARDALLSFTGSLEPCYAGTSWGKDSTVLAHLVATLVPRVPLVWVRIEPIFNPDCLLVRDEFLRTHDVNYHEIVVHSTIAEPGTTRRGWHWAGTLETGFAECARRWGVRRISGIRGEESGQRKRRMMHYGEQSRLTCAPIGWWTSKDVFAYLFSRTLPVHPAYACSMGGLLDHDRIRVASLGGAKGMGHGRAEWEERYYGREMRSWTRLEGATS